MHMVAPNEAFGQITSGDVILLPDDVESAHPVTARQAGLLFDLVRAEGPDLYQSCATIRLRGALDSSALAQAARDTVGRSPALRTSFALTGYSEPLQLVHRHKPAAVHVSVADLRGYDASEQQLIIDDATALQRRQPFPSHRPSLLRIAAHVLTDHEFQLTVSENHLVMEGWGWASVIAEVLERHEQLTVEAVGRAGFDGYARHWGFAPGLPDRPPPPAEAAAGIADLRPTGHPGVGRRVITLSMTEASEATRERLGRAVHFKVLSDLNGQQRPRSYVSHRRHVPGPRDRPCIGTVQPGWSWLRLGGSASAPGPRTPVDVGLVLLRDDCASGTDPGRFLDSGLTLLVTWCLSDSGAEVELLFDTDRVSAARIELIVRAYAEALRRAIDDPQASHDALGPLLPVTPDSAATDLTDDSVTTQDLVPAILGAEPDRPALRMTGTTITFGELAVRSAHVASALESAGVGIGDVVGLALPAGVDRTIAILGVWRVGAAYLPLDAEPAVTRLRALADAFALTAVITENAPEADYFAALFADRAALVSVLSLDRIPSDSTPDSSTSAIPSDTFAYLVPVTATAAVAVSRAQLLAALVGRDPEHHPSPGEIVAHDGRITDLDTWSTWTALRHGATVLLIEAQDAGDAARLHALLRRERVTRYLTTRAGALELAAVDRIAPAKLTLDRLQVLGDGAGPSWLETEPGPHTRLYHVHAAAETTTWTVGGEVTAATERFASVAVGRPRPGTTARVLDAELRPVPAGFVGALHLGGPHLASGYLGSPRLTAERFVPDPFATRPGSRLLRTGELARTRPDGELELTGRAADTWRIHGRLLDLEEVAAGLRADRKVRYAAVVARAADVVAYVVGEPDDRQRLRAVPADDIAYDVGQPDDRHRLRAVLADTVPEHAVPAAIVFADRLPCTADRTVDFAALPAPTRADFLAPRPAEPPRDVIEALIGALWRELLGHPVGIHERFRDVGGDPALLLRLRLGLRHRLGVRLSGEELGEDPTIAELADLVRRILARAQ